MQRLYRMPKPCQFLRQAGRARMAHRCAGSCLHLHAQGSELAPEWEWLAELYYSLPEEEQGGEEEGDGRGAAQSLVPGVVVPAVGADELRRQLLEPLLAVAESERDEGQGSGGARRVGRGGSGSARRSAQASTRVRG